MVDVTQHGYWPARSFAYNDSARSHLIEWLRMPGDMVFILFGALPMVVATTKAWIGTWGRGSAPAGAPSQPLAAE